MKSVLRGMTARTKKRVFGALFAIEALIAMFPPVYWWVASVEGDVFGLPFGMFYFLAIAAVMTATIIAIYVTEEIRGEVG